MGWHINQKRCKNTSKRLTLIHIRTFFKSKSFISKIWLKLVKNQANGKQLPESELLLFEIIHILHFIHVFNQKQYNIL